MKASRQIRAVVRSGPFSRKLPEKKNSARAMCEGIAFRAGCTFPGERVDKTARLLDKAELRADILRRQKQRYLRGDLSG